MEGLLIGLALGALIHQVVLPGWVKLRHHGR